MNIEPSDLRISDTEREDAISKLGEHMSVGRLGVDEYGERTAKVAAAKTRGELLALFTDLPDPRPSFSQTVTVTRPPAPAVQPPRPPAQSGGWDNRPIAQRVWGAMVPLSAVAALIVFLTIVHVWYVFLAPAVIAIVGGAIWGEDWRDAGTRHRSRRYRHGRWH